MGVEVGVLVGSGVLVGVAVCVGVGVSVGIGVEVGVADATIVGVTVGSTATDVVVGVGPHAVSNKRLKHTRGLFETNGFILYSFPIRSIGYSLC
jgi:hypothetical protein